MVEIPSSPDVAIVSGEFAGFSARALYEHFTDPVLLTHWWPQSAELDVQIGGQLTLTWPDMNWKLRGVFTDLQPDQHVGFTWNWDHEPNRRERQVDVYFLDQHELGSRLAIHHGPFGLDESEQVDRKGIVEGWIHFGMRLAGLRTGAAT